MPWAIPYSDVLAQLLGAAHVRRSMRKLWLADVIDRENTSESDIGRGIKSKRCPAPKYSETGRRFWFEWQWDENDRRVAALNLGPKVRPPPTTPSTQRKAVAARRKQKPRIVAPSRRKRQAEHAETDASI